MKNYTAVILTLIFVALAAIAFLLYQKNNKEAVTPPPNNIVKETKETSKTPEEAIEQKEDPTQIPPSKPKNEENSPTPITTGLVTGSLCYPSEMIPPMDVYLQEVDKNEYFFITTPENQGTFEFTDVSEGTYIAYAYLHDDSLDFGGGFTEMVPCGLSVDCEDHSFIEFIVEPGKTVSGIEICDWYGAVLPQRPN